MEPAARLLAVVLAAAALLAISGSSALASSLNWNDRPATNLLSTADVVVVDGVTVTTSVSGAGSVTSRTANILPALTHNGRTGLIQITMDAATDNGTVSTTTTFNFSEPVYNLTFTLVDIDGGTSLGWNDTIQFGPVPVATFVGSNVNYNATTGRATARGLAVNDARGDLTVRFNGPVTTVTVQYIADDANGTDPGNQILDIDDLTFDLSPRVTVSKVTVGGTGSFDFSGTNGFDSTTVTTLSPGTAASSAADALAALATSTTISEAANPAYALTGISCTGLGSGSASVNLAARSVTLSASAVVLYANINCTFTNTKTPTVRVQKQTAGGFSGPFSFSQTNLASSPSAITTTAVNSPAPASPAAINVTTIGSPVTLTETPASGYRLTAASCTDSQGAITGNSGAIGSLSGNTLTIPGANVRAGAEFTCLFSNALIPTVAVRKITLGDAGGPFTFSATNLAATPTAITTTAPGTAAPASPAAIAVSNIGQAVTISETVASGYAITAASCTDANAAVTGNTGSFGTLSGSTLTIPAARVVAGARFECTFTNRKIPVVRLQKVTLGGFGGPFGFTGTNLGAAPSGITTSVAGTPAPASPAAIPVTTNGTAVTITETAVAGYFVSGASCTDANSAVTGNTGLLGSLSGATLTIPGSAVVHGADFRCTFTNTLAVPQLAVAKSASVASVNAAGAAITYTVTVSNTGNVTVSGITVSDPLGSPACATSGNATIASLAPSAQETCTLTYAVTQADLDTNGGGDGDIDNTATASGSYGGTPVQASGSSAVALVINPQLSITKTADDTTDVVAGQVVTYTYVVTNTGNQTITDIGLSDSHNASGPVPVPGNETLSADAGPAGDSTDATANNGVWSSLAPGDAVTFTATYTVTQQDVDTRQ